MSSRRWRVILDVKDSLGTYRVSGHVNAKTHEEAERLGVEHLVLCSRNSTEVTVILCNESKSY